MPILLYGSEIWGFQEYEHLERVHVYACKRFLSVGLRACNNAVLGDCGRYPLYITSAKRCIKYWFKIISMTEDRYVKKCYHMMYYSDQFGSKNWVSHIRAMLSRCGFYFVWLNQGVENVDMFLQVFSQRMKDIYIQKWLSGTALNSKIATYIKYKYTFRQERYMDMILVSKYRHALAIIRTGNSTLEVVTGRHNDVVRSLRLCKLCNTGKVEDEFHFILECSNYTELMAKYSPKKFYLNPSLYKFTLLMNSDSRSVIVNLAIFCFHALNKRKATVS